MTDNNNDNNNKNETYPKTVEEAVQKLLEELPIREKYAIEKSDMTSLHFGLGMGIRNDFGLWGKNQELLESCKQKAIKAGLNPETHFDADEASAVIIKTLKQHFKDHPLPKPVTKPGEYLIY